MRLDRAAAGESMEPEKTSLEKKETKETKPAEPKAPVSVLEEFKSKAQEDLDALKEPQKTQLWKSIFRVKHDETPRSRSLGVLSNVFLHLHPARINRDAVRFSYTWGMGGITFYVYITLVF